MFRPLHSGSLPLVVVLSLAAFAGCTHETDGPLIPSASVSAGQGGPDTTPSDPQIGSTVHIDAAVGGTLVSGRVRITVPPGALPQSMALALTVVDPVAPRFRIDPAGTSLSKDVRVAVLPIGTSTRSYARARFVTRSSSAVPWRALETSRSATELYAYTDAFGEFLLANPEVKQRQPNTPGPASGTR